MIPKECKRLAEVDFPHCRGFQARCAPKIDPAQAPLHPAMDPQTLPAAIFRA